MTSSVVTGIRGIQTTEVNGIRDILAKINGIRDTQTPPNGDSLVLTVGAEIYSVSWWAVNCNRLPPGIHFFVKLILANLDSYF